MITYERPTERNISNLYIFDRYVRSRITHDGKHHGEIYVLLYYVVYWIIVTFMY